VNKSQKDRSVQSFAEQELGVLNLLQAKGINKKVGTVPYNP